MAPKDHKAHSFETYPPFNRSIGDWYSYIANLEADIAEMNMIDAVVGHDCDDHWDYGSVETFTIRGWIPLTDEEKVKAKERRAAERARKAAAKKENEEAERAELRRLAVLYPDEI